MISLLALSLLALSPTVKTHNGTLEGVPGKNPGVTVFKGIPFGAPPVGPLRWTAPRPAAPWQGVRKADQFRANCIQNIVDERKPWTHEFMAHGPISEDCLYLNIWTAAKSASAKLPVFVYIYGGGFNEGSGSVASYDGEGLAQKGLVMITVNYRVGVFGFLAHPELTKEAGGSGNYGLFDQFAALEWIRDNIAAFGGDPRNVTIAGQSAGAMSVHALAASPRAKGLFHRAIAQSGGSTINTEWPSLADGEQTGEKFAKAKGANSLADLRAMSAEQIAAPLPQGSQVRLRPIVDGKLIVAQIEKIVADRQHSDVPFLTGVNADEGGGLPNPTAKLADLQRLGSNTSEPEEFAKLYPATNDRDAGLANNDASRDRQRVGLQLWAEKRLATSKSKVYTYFWTHTLPGPDAARYGAFHTSEVPYALNTLYMSDRPFTPADHKIADLMSSYWANFAKTGSPNGKGLPPWPAAGPKLETMQIGDATEAISVAAPAKLAFWRKSLTRPRPVVTSSR